MVAPCCTATATRITSCRESCRRRCWPHWRKTPVRGTVELNPFTLSFKIWGEALHRLVLADSIPFLFVGEIIQQRSTELYFCVILIQTPWVSVTSSSPRLSCGSSSKRADTTPSSSAHSRTDLESLRLVLFYFFSRSKSVRWWGRSWQTMTEDLKLALFSAADNVG